MSRSGLYWAGLALCLLLGVWLRLAGLDRGASDFAVPGQFEYYQFHPDERGEALAHLRRAVELDPARAADLEKWLAAARDKER